MTIGPGAAEELFEDAPCGYLITRADGTILRVNRTFEAQTGLMRDDLVGRRRYDELLSVGGRIHHQTHCAPLLRMQGFVSEIAVEIVRADGSRMPALINSVVRREEDGQRELIRTTVFDATDRRRYEQELVAAQHRERDIARQLAASLMAGGLPDDATLDLAVGYQPAVAGLAVGGDWYDAFWLEDDRRVGLVIGDVVGRGIEAAATMGQLRSALRALASTGLAPGDLLRAMDGYVRRHDVGWMTTVVCVHLHLDSGEVQYACAGHPPPAMLTPGAAPRFLWDGRSPPLDSLARTRPGRPTAKTCLPPGSAILLYTDGLVERRGEPIDAGLERLAASARAHQDGDSAATVAAVRWDLRQDDHHDDVCLLLARRR